MSTTAATKSAMSQLPSKLIAQTAQIADPQTLIGLSAMKAFLLNQIAESLANLPGSPGNAAQVVLDRHTVEDLATAVTSKVQQKLDELSGEYCQLQKALSDQGAKIDTSVQQAKDELSCEYRKLQKVQDDQQGQLNTLNQSLNDQGAKIERLHTMLRTLEEEVKGPRDAIDPDFAEARPHCTTKTTVQTPSR